MDLMERCPNCWKSPSVATYPDGAWALHCPCVGLYVVAPDLSSVIKAWNKEVIKATKCLASK